MCEKERKESEMKKRFLPSMALFEEAILGHPQVQLGGGNKDFNLLTEAAVMQISETNKIRELRRAMGEIPETAKEKELKAKKEVAKEW